MKAKYNYVILNIVDDYIVPCFSELNHYSYVKTYLRAFNANQIVQNLFVMHWSEKINARRKLPLKKLWYSLICNHKFDNNNPICYIFLSGKYLLDDDGLRRYIMRKNPNNKCIVYYLDLIGKKKLDIQDIKSRCDYVVSYDKGESERYGMNYCDCLSYSPILPITNPKHFKYDIYFLGYAKDRLGDILKAFFYFSKQGYRCHFIVCGVPKSQQIHAEGLFFQEPITYEENIRYLQQSKCILEIIQYGSTGLTLRYRESIVYHRKLLTNNPNVKYEPGYNEENIEIFEKPEDISETFLKSEINYQAYGENPFVPEKQIAYFEKLLSENNNG